MIRDKIVVGIRSSSLSEKLQLDPDLTLSKAVTLVRQTEAVKQQQTILRGQGHGEGVKKPDTPVGAVLARRSGQSQTRRKQSFRPRQAPEVQLQVNSLPRLHAADVASHRLMTASSAQPVMQCVTNVPREDTISLFVDPLQESRKCTLTVSLQVLAKCS